jgi:hypothetical protein
MRAGHHETAALKRNGAIIRAADRGICGCV